MTPVCVRHNCDFVMFMNVNLIKYKWICTEESIENIRNYIITSTEL